MPVSLWWPMAEHLGKHFAERIEDVYAYAGTKERTKLYDKPTIEVLWDDEVGHSTHLARGGHVILWIDCIVAVSDTDTAAGYRAMYELQQKVFTALSGDPEKELPPWNQVVGEALGVGVSAEVLGITSNGTIKRPSFTSRIVLKTTWKPRFEF